MGTTFQSLNKRIDNLVEQHRDKPLLYYKEKKYTFNDVNKKVNQLVNGLCDMGVTKGTKVALMLPSDDFFVFSLLANMKIGAITIPINISHRGNSLKHILNQGEAEFIVYTEESHEQLIDLKGELTSIKKIVTYNINPDISKEWNLPVCQAEDFLEKCSDQIEFELEEMSRTDIMEIIYTSSTTGPPKGVVWDQGKFDTSIADDINFNSTDVMYTPLPLFHALGQRMLFMCLINGATIAISSRFSASNFWKDINKYGATWFNYIGAIIPILLKQPESSLDSKQLARNAYGCGAPQDKGIWEEFSNRFNVTLHEYYGTTESGAITLGTEPGSIGQPRSSHDVKILDADNQECQAGEIGELVSKVKNPNYDFRGYYKLREESEEQLINGWVRSGDLVYKDDNGYFHFVGRKVESMRRRGENISPWEIESVVNSHPKVIESAAIPISAEVGEDEIKVCVVLKENEELSAASLIEYCSERMANYLVPRYVEFRSSLPKTPTEKIERVKLKNEGLNNNTWDRETSNFQLQ